MSEQEDQKVLEQEIVEALLGSGTGGGTIREAPKTISNQERISRLNNFLDRLQTQYVFKPGDLVQWKEGLRNKSRPRYGEPVIVVDLLPKALRDKAENGSGSPYFQEPLQLVAADIDDDGDFVWWHYDARRFEPYKGQGEEK